MGTTHEPRAGTERPAPAGDGPPIELRVTRPEDGPALWRLTRDSGALDLNSPYAYVLAADRMRDTCVLAEADGRPAGFVLGLRDPARSHVLFVWQVAVDPDFRGRGLGRRMLEHLLDRDPHLTTVEATVTPSNSASDRLFRGLARTRGWNVDVTPGYDERHLPQDGHEPELLYHLAPTRTER